MNDEQVNGYGYGVRVRVWAQVKTTVTKTDIAR
jgi:hypothetical protein